MDSIPAQGTKIPHAMPHSQKKKKEQEIFREVMRQKERTLSF